MTIQEKENEIINEFKMFQSWDEKYEYLIELGKSLPLIDEKHKTKDYLVSGCQSQVWLKADYENRNMIYKADSDAVITKGLISLLIRVLSGQKPRDILNAKLDFLEKIGMKEHLSITRANGLQSMINHMKKYAQQYSDKNE